ncbi:hypothetical protein CP967_15665 [Streptomyces nitrosporeus]|uniref:Peptidase C83 domain-containing protein n=1 Tax=Streptomyces nitrosporeus TaxID=28894 RepID=A0A5J6FCL8_9ACTN|nr:hypothetical protein [Streptomyces nitrosporeus]QEU73254.1 hypothetical protein CP967_15665 [Streptomyces nitrosporeus]GGZ09421.1 hypothetical protein GCM10010327_44870 [Streptomyces nitrosporeus]
MSNDEQRYGQGYPDQGARPYDAHQHDAHPYDAPPGPEAARWPESQDQGQWQGDPQGYGDPGAAQTWQGQTWDTRYQPTVRPQASPAAQPPEAGPYPYPDPYTPPGPDPYGHAAPQHPAAAYPEPSGPPAPVYDGAPYAQAPYDGAPYAPYDGPAYDGAPRPDARQQPYPAQEYPAQEYPDRPYPAGAPAPAAGTFAPQGGGGAPLPPEAPAPPTAPAPPAPAPAAAPAPAPGASAPAAAGADGYGPATTLGNSRVTDAQRARAEGRSPVIAPGMQPAAITAALGLLLAAGAAVGQYALAVPLVLLQAVTAAGWFRLNGMWPARQGIALAFAGGFAADVVLLAVGRENGPAALLGTLGVWVLLTLVLQLRSRAGADERLYGLTATLVSAALAVLAAGHLAAVPDAVVVGAFAVAVAVPVRALPLTGPASVAVALLAATGAGAAAGALTGLGAQAALLGFAAGGCALIGLRVASYDYPSRFVHMTAGVALPLTAAAPAVYLIGRVLV